STSSSSSSSSTSSGCVVGLKPCGGQCLDLSFDPANCGSCGHDCQGGTCAGGVCQAVTLATGPSGASGIAVDATNVFWTAGGSPPGAVMKVPIAGGPPTVLASGQDLPDSIAVDATSVYWTSLGAMSGVPTVMKVPIAGGTPVTLASGTPNT